jgi:hypothetical protein
MTIGKIRKRDQGWRLREAANLKFTKGREGKEPEGAYKEFEQDKEEDFC